MRSLLIRSRDCRSSLPGTAEWTRRPCILLTSQSEIAATGSELVLRPHGNACEQSRRRHRSMRRRRREYCRLISCSAVAGLDGPPGALLYPGCGAGRRLSFSSCHAAPVQYCPLHPRLGPYFRVPAARGSAASDYSRVYSAFVRSCPSPQSFDIWHAVGGPPDALTYSKCFRWSSLVQVRRLPSSTRGI